MQNVRQMIMYPLCYKESTTGEKKQSVSCEALELFFRLVCAAFFGDRGFMEIFPSKDRGCPLALLYEINL